LVLSGGQARGAAHLGVLKVLEREGIPIDMIVGASFGSLVGGLYALGYKADERMKALGSDVSFSRYDADFRQYLSLSNKSNIQLYGSAGYARRSIPFYENFYIGGFSYSEGGPRRLMGFECGELSAKQIRLLAVSYRYRWLARAFGFAKRGFLTGYYNAAAISSRQKTPYDFTFYHGAGAEFSLDTIVGPLRLAGGWGEGGRFNIYFSFGTSF
jgi:outer membrane protein assembly factor BamA